MSRTNDLAQDLIAALDASPLGRDEKLKAIGVARNHLNHQHTQAYAFTGPVGTGKKTEELRQTINDRKKKPAPKAPRN